MRSLVTLLLTFIFSTIGYSQDSYNVDLLYHWEDTTLVPSSQHDNTYNETWGFVQNGKEYGVIGSTAGTHLFDLSNPSNIYQVSFIPGEAQGPQIIHRDYHDYKGYLYIVCDEDTASKLKIVDLSPLPNDPLVVYNSNELFSRSHNIFIDTAKAKLYTCGGNNNPGVRVFDLTNPELPVEISSISLPETSHDIFVRNDTAYVNVGSNGGLQVYDFSDNNNPQLIASLTSYPQQGYNHSGWLNENGSIYVLADETHNMDLKILDVSNLNNIEVLDTIDTEKNIDFTIAHNLMVKNNFVYVSYYYDGMYIFNIEDPENSFISGYYDTSTRPHQNFKYQGCWGVYTFLPSGRILASDMQTGFYVFDVSKATGINGGIDKLETAALQLYPNPATSEINFINLPDGNSTFKLIDYSGKVIQTGNISPNDNNVKLEATESTGIYKFVILNNNKKQTIPFVYLANP